MNKGLEELNKIKKLDILYDIEMTENGEEYMKDKDIVLSIIEEELEDLDTIKEIFSYYELEYKLTSVREALLLLKQYQGSYGVRGQALITKKLRALEIIKNKKVNSYAIKSEFKASDYNELMTIQRDRYLTEEEYDLLKEVLL